EQLSHVALDYDELKKANNSSELEQKYELSDGQVITVGTERFRRTKVLFEPNSIVLEQEGEHKLTFQSIMKCDIDIKKDLYNNIVMIGGTAMFNGISGRMQKKIKYLYRPNRKHRYNMIALFATANFFRVKEKDFCQCL
ncbi:hypothetical protein RFI_36120, partial [Reticulomyxa filosa]